MAIMLKIAENSDYKRIYEDLESQFPKEELKSKEKFLALSGEEAYEVRLALSGGVEVGYLTTVFDKKSCTLWLDYFAIYKEFHSKGYGSAILKSLIAQSDSNGCFLELEKPDDAAPNTTRRIEFYKRLGAFRLDVDYLFPHSEGVLPMELYYLPIKSTQSPSKKDIFSAIENTFEVIHDDIPHRKSVFDEICLG